MYSLQLQCFRNMLCAQIGILITLRLSLGRVTCRDWFQLSLKEGLTVFRDQVRTFYI
jgi:hypothetical protein